MNQHQSMLHHTVVLLASTICLLSFLGIVSANGPVISSEQAIEVARKELTAANLNPERYEPLIDEDNKSWSAHMELLKTSSIKSSREKFMTYQSVLEGRRYWTIFLLGKSAGGRLAKDDSITVIVDRESGAVLFFIPGG